MRAERQIRNGSEPDGGRSTKVLIVSSFVLPHVGGVEQFVEAAKELPRALVIPPSGDFDALRALAPAPIISASLRRREAS